VTYGGLKCRNVYCILYRMMLSIVLKTYNPGKYFTYLMRAKRKVSLDMWDAQLLPLVEVLGDVAVEQEQDEGEQQQDLHQHPGGGGVGALSRPRF
jgi:hypothetical protein